MAKIQMTTPLAELDGDEMTRVIWRMIKEELLIPHVELKTEYYDLGLPNRDKTGDEVTRQAAHAILRLGVGVKCATITANRQRGEEYALQKIWPSANATIRGILDGAIFRTPIRARGLSTFVRTWEKPITIARHAYGDLSSAREIRVAEPGEAELTFRTDGGREERVSIHRFQGPGVLMGMHNLDDSICTFARLCFQFALDTRQDMWFGAKDTVSKTYDHTFRALFQDIYHREFRDRFEQAGIRYQYTLIDDAISRAIRSQGGFLWACQNYDGDIMSDLVATAFGSLAMMTSVLVSGQGVYEYEAAHGSVTHHFYRHRAGEETSTNPIATIFAWSGALRKRGQLDGLTHLVRFADDLERACLDTVEAGVLTGDLVELCLTSRPRPVTLKEMMAAIRARLSAIRG